MNINFKISPLIYASNYLIKGLCVIFFIGVCLDASAQTKKPLNTRRRILAVRLKMVPLRR